MSASRDEIALAKIPAGKAIWSLSGDEAREYYEDKIRDEVDIIGGKYRRVAHIAPIQHPDMGATYALIFLREIRGGIPATSFFLSADAAGAALMDGLVNDVKPHMARPRGKIITSGLAQSDEKPDGKITKTGISWRKVSKENENYADSPTATEGFFGIFSKSHLTPQEQKSVRRLLKKIPAAKLMRELKLRDAQEKDNAKKQEIWNRQIELADKMGTRGAVGIM